MQPVPSSGGAPVQSVGIWPHVAKSFVFFSFLVTLVLAPLGPNTTKTLRCSASTLTSIGVMCPPLINNRGFKENMILCKWCANKKQFYLAISNLVQFWHSYCQYCVTERGPELMPPFCPKCDFVKA